MASMKYIRFRVMGFVMFQEHIEHKAMADRFPDDQVESAGFVASSADDGYMRCFGESVSLNKSSRSNDTEKLERKLSIYV